MGFWDNAKKVASATKNAMEEAFERQLKSMPDAKILEGLSKYPNNKLIRQEAEKRRLI